MHKMSEIIAAILHNGIEIEDFEEYPFDLDGDPNKDVEGKFPFSYLITAKKKYPNAGILNSFYGLVKILSFFYFRTDSAIL